MLHCCGIVRFGQQNGGAKKGGDGFKGLHLSHRASVRENVGVTPGCRYNDQLYSDNQAPPAVGVCLKAPVEA